MDTGANAETGAGAGAGAEIMFADSCCTDGSTKDMVGGASLIEWGA